MTGDRIDWCFQCEQWHAPMGWGDGCVGQAALARERLVRHLPWAPAFGWLTGRQCRARLRPDEGRDIRRWGRCELRWGHVAADDPEHVDHALEYGMTVARWRAFTPPPARPYLENGLGR